MTPVAVSKTTTAAAPKSKPPLPPLASDSKAAPSASTDSKLAKPTAAASSKGAGTATTSKAFGESQYSRSRVPVAVKKYRENDQVRVFYYARGIQKSKDKKPANEFKDLWVQKTFVYAAESFPATHRRIEIAERREVTLTPIQNAVATIANKNRELSERMDAVDSAPPGPVDVGPLSMLLNGMIDAAVNGGTNKYIEAFLGSDFKAENDAAKQHQKDLRQSLRDQLALLKRGLTVFSGRRSADLKGLNDHLNGTAHAAHS